MQNHGEIVFDLETKNAFADISNRNNLDELGVSVVGCFIYGSQEFKIFTEDEIPEFEGLLLGASRIIGYNIRHFDYAVLQPHLKSVVLKELPTLDLMLEPAAFLGFRPKLDDLAKATLGVSKSGHGLEAVQWYRRGELDKLKSYCLDDVRITKDLFEYGADKNHVLLDSRYSKERRQIPVSWQRLIAVKQSQSSLF